MEENSAIKPLNVTKLVRKRENYNQTLKILEMMQEVQQRRETIQKCIISKMHYVQTLDLIDETKKLLETELAGIKCFG